MVFTKKVKEQRAAFANKRKVMLKKGFSVLPHVFTLGNAFFGFCSIVFAARGELLAAAYFILLGALMDAIDGRLARFMGLCSEFGVQLDSLSDAISFCLAPAFLAYFWQLRQLGFVGIIISALFMLAGLARLARFNVLHEKQTVFFMGLPTTIAGCFLATLLLNFQAKSHNEVFLFLTIFLVLGLAGLMVSRVSFPTFKKHKLLGFPNKKYKKILLLLLAIVAVMQLKSVLLIFFVLYFLSALIIKIKFAQPDKGL